MQQRLLDLVLQPTVEGGDDVGSGDRGDGLVAAGDRTELAVVLLLLFAVDAAKDVVVLLLETGGALQVRVGATDHAAADVTGRKHALVFADRRDPRQPELHDGRRQLRIDLPGDVHERVLLRRERLGQRQLLRGRELQQRGQGANGAGRVEHQLRVGDHRASRNRQRQVGAIAVEDGAAVGLQHLLGRALRLAGQSSTRRPGRSAGW